uniref:Uncharacterized protein n=1 Tax=Arion vulgaris TaxID=1028688 RepID=A0A0B6YPL3_9EUPU
MMTSTKAAKTRSEKANDLSNLRDYVRDVTQKILASAQGIGQRSSVSNKSLKIHDPNFDLLDKKISTSKDYNSRDFFDEIAGNLLT